MIPHFTGCFPVLFLIVIECCFLASPLSLPQVDPGLFVIQGVSTCGLGGGYCLLSNSCLVDSDFESDTNGGHCDGLKHAFNPNADFVCCKYISPSTTPVMTSSTSINNDETTVVAATKHPPPPALSSVSSSETNTHHLLSSEDETLAEKVATTTIAPTSSTSPRTFQPVTQKKNNISPFNIAANTNKILSSIQHLLHGGRMRPSVVLQKYSQNQPEVYNDKSLVNLILLGLNTTPERTSETKSSSP